MRFEELYPNYLDMTPDAQKIFFMEYRDKRASDLAEVVIALQEKGKRKARASSKGKDKKIAVTQEQLALLQKLGLV